MISHRSDSANISGTLRSGKKVVSYFYGNEANVSCLEKYIL